MVNVERTLLQQGRKKVIIAGPCAVESKEQILRIAIAVQQVGADMLRGGAYKPRTHPQSFQGLGKEGLQYLAEVREQTGLPIVTEIMGSEDINLVNDYADVLQIGSRNMHNYDLLKKVGNRASETPILLKRGMSATKEETLGAINYLIRCGHNGKIAVCERGIRTFASGEYSRNTLDVCFIADLSFDSEFPYPVFVDPSHAAGRRELVERLTYAGFAAGASGAIIEVHDNPEEALSDGRQSVSPRVLEKIIGNIRGDSI